MKQISLVKDKIDGSPFAVLLIDKGSVTAYGSPGQGEDWAEWVNSQETSVEEIQDVLDVRLVAEPSIPAKKFNESSISSYLGQEAMDLLMAELNKKALLEIVQVKSESQPQEYDEEDLPDYTPISVWPLSEISLASIDVAYKSQLADYKAKAFNADRNRRALALEVKWARAIWDNDRQGWRCPPETTNGGQFTNRMGLGCTTGLVRRLGQSLMSIEDRNKLQMQLPGLEDPRGFLYRSGSLIDQRAETRQREFADRQERRAARRVRSLIEKEGKKEQERLAKENKRKHRSGESLRDIYSSFTPDASRVSRARAAGAVKLRRFASNVEQESLRNIGASQQRRDRRVRDVSEEKLDSKKIRKLRDFGGKIPGSKLGGYVQYDKMMADDKGQAVDINGELMVPRVLVDMDEMHSNPYYGREFLTDDSGNQVENFHANHKWVTVEEVLAMASINRATKPAHDWIEMRKGRGFPGDETIEFVEAKELRKIQKDNGFIGVRSSLKDKGKGRFDGDTRGKGKKKTKPAQGGSIGDMEFEPDELPPTVAKRFGDAWRDSRKRLGSWIANLDPLLDEDQKTRREKRRRQKASKSKDSSAINGANILQSLFSDIDDPIEATVRYAQLSNFKEPEFRDWYDYTTNNKPVPERREDWNFGFNSVIGEPTPHFARLKNLIDGIVSEHAAGVLITADDSEDPDITKFIFQDYDFSTKFRSGQIGNVYNVRVVTRTDGVEEVRQIAVDSISLNRWTDNPLDENRQPITATDAGLYMLWSNTTFLDVPEDVVERAASGQMPTFELVELAAKQWVDPGYHGAQPPAFYYDQATKWHEHYRVIGFNQKGAPLYIKGAGGRGRTGSTSVHIPGTSNSVVDTRTGGLISGRMSQETIITPEGQRALDDPNVNIWTGEQNFLVLDGGPAPGRGRRRRRTSGPTPQSPGVVSRFLDGEGRQLSRERRSARRMLKGRTPKDTRPIRQRIEAALYERSRRRSGEPRPISMQAPDIDINVYSDELRRMEESGESIEARNALPPIDGVYDWLLPDNFSAGNDWWGSGVNQQRIDTLNASLHELGGSFFPLVSQRDIDRLPQLAEEGRKWLEDINDPDKDSAPGEVSNWGFAEWKEYGGYTYVYDSRNETKPPIAIVNNESGTTHMIGKDGQHLMTLVTRVAPSGETVFLPVGSNSTHKRLDNITEQPGFLQTVLGKFRRRQQQDINPEQIIPGLRSRERAFTRGDNTIEDVRSQFENGTPSDTFPYSFATKQRTGALAPTSLTTLQEESLLEEADKLQVQIADDFRRQLGLNKKDQLTEEAIKDLIDDLQRRGKKREAGIATNNLHDLAVLDDMLQSRDVMHVNNLKPGRRHLLLGTSVNPVPDSEQKRRRAMTPDMIHVSSNSRAMDSRLSDRGDTDPATSKRTYPSGAINLYEPSEESFTPSSPRPQTGPALIPGEGDATGTIVYQNGMYFDTSTNRYVEDLSGLDFESADFVHVPVPLEESSTNGIDDLGGEFPKILLTSGPGAPSRQSAVIAPGVSSTNPEAALTSRPDAVNAVVAKPNSFTEAFYLVRNRWRQIAATKPADQTEPYRKLTDKIGADPAPTAFMLSSLLSPLLSKADGLESEEGVSLYSAPIHSPTLSGSDNAAGILRAIRNASRKSPTENGLFSDYLPGSSGDIVSYSGMAVGPHAPRGQTVLDAIGVFADLPFETVYIPSTQPIAPNVAQHNSLANANRTLLDTKIFRSLNAALQLDYASQKMRQLLDSGTPQEITGWNDTWGKRFGGRFDITQADIESVEQLRDAAWQRAAEDLSSVAKNAGDRRNDFLNQWRNRSQFRPENREIDAELSIATEYITNGVIAEQAEYLLTKHILTNPRIMQSLAQSELVSLESRSREANKRMERLEAIRSAQTALGRRSMPGYSPEDIDPIELLPVLDRHGDGVVTNASLRDPAEIVEILSDHKSLGFGAPLDIDPATGEYVPSILTDDQMEALALIDYSIRRNLSQGSPADEYGYTGMPEANTVFGHLELDNLPPENLTGWQRQSPGAAAVWSLMEASGFNGNPLLLDVEEFKEIAKIEDSSGKRQTLVVTRGIDSHGRNSGSFLTNLLLRAKRSLLGSGGAQHGTGEYWSAQPFEWRSNSESSAIGMIVRGNHRVGSHELLVGTDSSARTNGSNGILSDLFYEATWAVANALGARGFGSGTNPSHGQEYAADIPVNSVKIDPVTGLYDQADLDNLQLKILELTRAFDPSQGLGSAGLMTLEKWADRRNFVTDSIIPDLAGGAAASNFDRNESAIRERQFLNAWLGQHLSWMVQLAQMRRDESDRVNGKENAQWNRRLDAAQHSIVMMDPNARAAMMGYDVLIRHDQNSHNWSSRSQYDTDASYRFGDYDFWEQDSSRITLHNPKVLLMLNRTATPMLRRVHSSQTWAVRSNRSGGHFLDGSGLTIADILQEIPANPTTPEEQYIADTLTRYIELWGGL